MKGVSIIMKKLYYAYVGLKVNDYFENKLRENGVAIISRDLVINSNDDELYCYYIIEADEGIIDSKWELKAQR